LIEESANIHKEVRQLIEEVTSKTTTLLKKTFKSDACLMICLNLETSPIYQLKTLPGSLQKRFKVSSCECCLDRILKNCTRFVQRSLNIESLLKFIT
jgi:hypothetical protein